MNPAEYQRMYDHEDNYWWFISRRQLVCQLIDDSRSPGDLLLCDVGCGTGATMQQMLQFGKVIGIDMSPLALRCCRQRGLNGLIMSKAEQLPLKSNSADVIVATDILEHLADDISALKEFHRILRPGGFAVITVPAFGLLWSEHDLALMHHRRYTAPQLAQRCKESGFRVDRTTYALWLLFPFAVVTRLLQRRYGKTPQARIPKLPYWLNNMLINIQRFEMQLLKHMDLPWGVSIAAVIRKDSDTPSPQDKDEDIR